MIPQHQAFRHDPDNGVYGDCARTAFATLLGVPRDDVPHFAYDNPIAELFWQRISDWGSELFSDPSPEGGDITEPLDGFYYVVLASYLSPSD